MAFEISKAALERIGERAVAARAINLQNEIKENLSRPGTGIVYKKAQRQHQASKPGEPPAPDQGELRRSFLVRKLEPGHYRVATHLAYGLVLEFGGRNLAPRPYVRPAIEAIKAR